VLKEEGDEAGVKAKGKVMTKGKDYIVEDGDICYFKSGMVFCTPSLFSTRYNANLHTGEVLRWQNKWRITDFHVTMIWEKGSAWMRQWMKCCWEGQPAIYFHFQSSHVIT